MLIVLTIVSILPLLVRKSWVLSTPIVLAFILLYFILPVQKQFNAKEIWISDEAQLVVQARMFQEGRLPWTEVDMTTSGPLNSMLPNLGNFITGRATITSARVISRITLGVSVFFLFLGFIKFFSPQLSWLLSLPLLYSIGLNSQRSLAGYHSGVVPILLFSLSFYFWACYKKNKLIFPLMISLGFAGLQIMAKLQAAPAAFVWAAFIIFSSQHKDQRFKLTASFVAPTFILLLPTIIDYGLIDFVLSYLISGFNYGPHVIYGEVIRPFFDLPITADSILMIGMVICCILVSVKSWKKSFFWQFVVILFCIFFPRVTNYYYIALIFVPVSILFALALGDFLERIKFARWAFVCFCIIASAIGIKESPKMPPYWEDLPERYHWIKTGLEKHDVKGEMVIWGWSPEIYLATDTMPGTRDSIAQYGMFKNQLTDYYNERLVFDMESRKPKWFLNGICLHPVFFNKCELDNYKIIHSYISSHYTQVESLKEGTHYSVTLWKRIK